MIDAQQIVAITRCQAYTLDEVRQALCLVLEPFGGPQGFIQPGWRVLLKPNFVVADPAEALSVTHPVVVEAAILEVREAGGIPVVGDSPAFGSACRVAKVSGVWEVCQRHRVELVDLDGARRVAAKASDPVQERFFDPSTPIGTGSTQGGDNRHGRVTRYRALTISGRALEADLVLNLPKLKAHCQLRLTAAVKNLYGCVSGKRKWWRHMTSGNDLNQFACMLVKNAYLLPRTFTIVDAIVGMHKTGPRHGAPYPMGLLVAGPDPVAVDRVLAEIIGLVPEQLATLEAARMLGLGVPEIETIEVVGEPLEAVRVPDFQVPEELHDIIFRPTRVVQSLFRTLWLSLTRRPRLAREHTPTYH